MRPGPGTIIIVAALLIGFGVELATYSAGNDTSLLKLGALPDNGELHGQYWRLATYSFLHFNGVHLLVNLLLLSWVGGKLEQRIDLVLFGAIYVSSVIVSAAMILLVHSLNPKMGATVGASGGIFGLLAAALIISYRYNARALNKTGSLRTWLWVVLVAGLGISFLPGISMAGHVGGLIGGALAACIAPLRKNV